ncbi:MAG: hypothetical protein JXL81_00740 [Deltaproteobacteria bacterium]|nr:hypothetical protein [Deltaproteobacteria bacterium]
MNRSLFYLVKSVALVFFNIFSVTSAGAHGTDCRIIERAGTVTFEFFYDDMEPMQYSEVLVFSPHDDKVEYQNGRTDSKGRFSFFPEDSGTWRIEASDGMGHLAKGAVDVAPDTDMQADTFTQNIKDEGVFSGNISKPFKVIFGLSLIINIWAIFFILKTKNVIKKAVKNNRSFTGRLNKKREM